MITLIDNQYTIRDIRQWDTLPCLSNASSNNGNMLGSSMPRISSSSLFIADFAPSNPSLVTISTTTPVEKK